MKLDFSLIETILWENGEYFLLDLHLKRLKKSAQYFSFFYNETDIDKVLKNLADKFDSSKKYRVRFLLKQSGVLHLEFDLLNQIPSFPVKIVFSDKKIDKNDIFLKHKTTNRLLYDQQLKKYRKNGFFDCLFLNQEMEVTEGAITNIVIQKGKNWWTPPVTCGLLVGVYREYLLKKSKISLEEKILYKDDLLSADMICVINSVRKMVPATLSP